MKAVILAGGLGTRLSEETNRKPKPMVDIGGKPILWHIMKIYSYHGINDFIICCGYKGYLIKEYFANYFLHQSDVTFNLAENNMEIHSKRTEPWRVTLVDTGDQAQTGGRLLRVKPYLENENVFCLTYGDGLADIDITASISFHKKHNKAATITAVSPPGRFGALKIKNDLVSNFSEKPTGDGDRINGGFFVLNREVLNLISGDDEIFENYPLTTLAKEGQLVPFKHDSFWQPMDTLRDTITLETLWQTGVAPWKKW